MNVPLIEKCTFHMDHIIREDLFFYLHLFTFTFMHLADAFIPSDLHCIQVTVFTFYQLFNYLNWFV